MIDWGALVGPAWAAPGRADDAVDGVVPASVVRPAGIEQLQAVVRAAADGRQALVASGRGAHLDIGAPPARLDVLVRLDRLDRLVDHQAADMTVTVETGCSLACLAAALAAAGQWLPVDAPRPEDTTVGGLIAADLSDLPTTPLFGPIVWLRFRLPDLLPDRSRVIYLDSDTLVMSDLHALWETRSSRAGAGSSRTSPATISRSCTSGRSGRSA